MQNYNSCSKYLILFNYFILDGVKVCEGSDGDDGREGNDGGKGCCDAKKGEGGNGLWEEEK
jgi:hypothetical protein